MEQEDCNTIKIDINAVINFIHNNKLYTASTETSEVDYINNKYPLDNKCKFLLENEMSAEARDINNNDLIERGDPKLDLATISTAIAACLRYAMSVPYNSVVLTNGAAHVTSINVSILQKGEWNPFQHEKEMTVQVAPYNQ